jgi:hypothetical protein
MHRSIQTPIGVSMGSHRLLPRRIVPELILLNPGAAHSQVLIGFEDFSGSRRALVGAAY